MNMGLIITIILVFLGVFGGMAFLVVRQLKKTDPSNADSSISDSIETAQEFLPFKDIRDGVIDLGGHNYRAIIECSSTNYNLKTDKEKEIIEVSFQRFLNSLTFPIYFFIQTKTLDNTKLLAKMEEELTEVTKKYPQMSEYAEIYLREMTNLDDYVGNNKQKKKFIIVPYNEAIGLNDLTEEEKYEYSVKEVKQRARMLEDGLSAVGVKTKLLDTKGLAELVYSTYHKDNYSHYESIVDGEFLTLMVEGENREEQLTNDMRMDWILYEAQMRIRNEITSNKQTPKTLKKDYEKVIKEIDELRDNVGAYYKDE